MPATRLWELIHILIIVTLLSTLLIMKSREGLEVTLYIIPQEEAKYFFFVRGLSISSPINWEIYRFCLHQNAKTMVFITIQKLNWKMSIKRSLPMYAMLIRIFLPYKPTRAALQNGLRDIFLPSFI